MVTRQALKNLLHYLQETNGEAHLYLNDYLATNGAPKVDAEYSARAWLARLAAQPPVVLSDPGRSSAPSAAAAAQASSTREVSPRDLVERVLATRLDVAAEIVAEMDKMGASNAAVLLATLSLTLSESPPLED